VVRFTEDEANRFVAAISAVADVVPDPPASPQRLASDLKDEFLVALARVADVAALVSWGPRDMSATNI